MAEFRIECEDVYLRSFEAADLEAFHSLTWQPEIYKYLPGWNVSLEQRTDWFMNYELPENAEFAKTVLEGGDAGELRLRLAIALKGTGELIGWCCSGIKDELPPPNREIMYAISQDYQGKGYATQAARGMIGYLFEHTNVRELCAVALLGNVASNRVIEKCGFRLEGAIEMDGESYNSYRLEKRAWVERQGS